MNTQSKQTAHVAKTPKATHATQQAHAMQKNPQDPKLLDAIVEASHDAFIGMGTDGCVTHWNRQAERMFGWSRAEAIGQPLADLIIPVSAREAHAAGLSHYLATGRGNVVNSRVKMQALRRSGELFPIEMTISVFGDNPTNQIFFTFLHDASEREKIEHELSTLARTDMLTELPNRRHLYERLDETLARVNRTHRLMAIMFMDIDYFKSINDSLGHDVGDAVLLQFASRLKASVRQVDFVARLGGDEFMVVAEELVNEDNAIVLAQKIVENVAQPMSVNGHHLHVTTSIGIASYAGEQMSVDALIQRADQAMYQAKRSGRNTFRIAREDEIQAKHEAIQGAMGQFFERLSTNELNADAFLQEALHSIRIHLGMDVAFISEFKNGRRVFKFIDSSDPNPPIAVGGSDPLEDSFCQRVIDGRLPELMPDAFLNAHAMSLPVTQALPVRAHLSVPIMLRNGEIYGTYCCFSSKADQSMNERDIGMMRVFAELVAQKLDKKLSH